MSELAKVRGLGSGKVHLSTFNEWMRLKWIGPEFDGTQPDVEALCGVRPRGRAVVKMLDETSVDCVLCRHIAGNIEETP